MHKNRSLGLLAAALLALPLAGCFDVEESIDLNRDLSGTTTLHMTVDFDAMVPVIAGFQHSMTGKEGPPTQAELDDVRKQIAATGNETKTRQQDDAAQLAKSLPPGVTLLSSGVDQNGMKITGTFTLGFDDVHKLSQISLPNGGQNAAGGTPAGAGGGAGTPPGAGTPAGGGAMAAGAGPGAAPGPAGAAGGNPYQQPWSGLRVVDEGKTLLITMEGADPASHLKGQPGFAGSDAMPDMSKQLAAIVGNARFVLRLDTPFQVVTTTATRREGRTLIWEFKLSDPDAAPKTVMVRLKK